MTSRSWMRLEPSSTAGGRPTTQSASGALERLAREGGPGQLSRPANRSRRAR